MSTFRSKSLEDQPASPHNSNRRGLNITDPTNESSSIPPSTRISTAHLSEPDYLPFTFGAEFELILRPKQDLDSRIGMPDTDVSVGEARNFNWKLLEVIAELLSTEGLPCNAYSQNDEDTPDYSKWNATLDGSLSKKHIKEQFYPVEIVSPKITADNNWSRLIDQFWHIMDHDFEFRQDTSCGFHVHISSANEKYSLSQLRCMTKAVVFWEPHTAKCAPLSRQDRVLGMCKSNVRDPVPVAAVLSALGPWRGLSKAFEYIDNASRDEIVNYICPDKYRAWNFNSCRKSGFGSIEFRRAPGVVTAKKARHWIAFVMAFVEMAIQFNPKVFADSIAPGRLLHELGFPEFEARLLECARNIGVYADLDSRIQQPDFPRTLHITTMSQDSMNWLKQHDIDYHYSRNA